MEGMMLTGAFFAVAAEPRLDNVGLAVLAAMLTGA